MSVSGKYVNTFAEASHAVPDGMYMNADYPFMLPRIVELSDVCVVVKSDRRQDDLRSARICLRGGRQCFLLRQSSSYEVMFGCGPTEFVFYPFKDEHTPAIRPAGGSGKGAEPPATRGGAQP